MEPASSRSAAVSLLAAVAQAPAVRTLARRVERGGMLSACGVSPAAQTALAAALRLVFPRRPIVVVTDGLKAQELAQQDLETWLAGQVEEQSPPSNTERSPEVQGPESKARGSPPPRAAPLFFPAWEVLPHDARLPHADVISERLETLVALLGAGVVSGGHVSVPRPSGRPAEARNRRDARPAPVVVASVPALLQRTFTPGALRERTRSLARGDRVDPLDLVEWLEDQGYEPEAQVTAKGEIALRGGIVDVFPLSSPWPVRLEFFGDELESLRQFDPLTQISREEIARVVLPPGGELGLLKRALHSAAAAAPGAEATSAPALATLADYLPAETLWLLCEPDALDAAAAAYAAQAPAGDPFFMPWDALRRSWLDRGCAVVELTEAMLLVAAGEGACAPMDEAEHPLTPDGGEDSPDADSRIEPPNRRSDPWGGGTDMPARRFGSGVAGRGGDRPSHCGRRDPPPRAVALAGGVSSIGRATGGTAGCGGAAAGVFQPVASVAAPGLCRPRLLQQRGRAAKVRGDLEGVWAWASGARVQGPKSKVQSPRNGV